MIVVILAFFAFNGIIRDDFLVNQDTIGGCRQSHADIAIDSSGNFAIAWIDTREGDNSVYAKLYSNDCVPNSLEFRVNDNASISEASFPCIGMDNSGGFCVVWCDKREGDEDIYAQVFEHNGTPIGTNFKVNDGRGRQKMNPAIAMNDSMFVVVWQDDRNGDWDIFSQLLSSNGTPIGSNFGINETTANDQTIPRVAIDSTGNFCVAWASRFVSSNAYCRIFLPDGTPVDTSFAVSDTVNALCGGVDVAMDMAGEFCVVWADYGTSPPNVRGQRYSNIGTPLGSNFEVGPCYVEPSVSPYIAMDGTGNFCVIWKKGSGSGITAQRYSEGGNPVDTNFVIMPFDFFAEPGDYAIAMNTVGELCLSSVYVSLDYMIAPRAPEIYASKYHADGSPQQIKFRVENDEGARPQQYPWVTMNTTGSLCAVWIDDADCYGTNMSGYISSLSGSRQVHFAVYGEPESNFGVPCVSMNDNTDVCVTWSGFTLGKEYWYEICAQVFDSNGLPRGYQLSVGEGEFSVCAIDDSGRFWIAWHTWSGDICAKRYLYDGTQVDSFGVNDDTTGHHQYPCVAVDSDGDFCLSWLDTTHSSIYAQRYMTDGTPVGSNFMVNDSVSGITAQSRPSMGMDESGNFVIVWQDNRNGDADVYAQMYDANGSLVGTNFRINEVNTGEQTNPSVTVDPFGNRFVVMWTDYRNPNGDPEAMARRFVGSIPLGPDIQINQPDFFPHNHQMTDRMSVACDSTAITFCWLDNRRHKNWDVYAKVMDWDFYGIKERPTVQVAGCKLQVWPNPFTHNTVVKFGVRSSEFIDEKLLTLTIHDLAGRVVRTLNLPLSHSPSLRVAEWDATDSQGNKVTPGIYFCKLQTGDLNATEKLILVE